MRILELTNYSSGICGVWQRVQQEALELSRLGHEVRVFSSNKTKGSKEIACTKEVLGKKVKIFRFKAKHLGGESFLSWNFKKELEKFKPDIIIAHSYRHLHTTQAIKIAKKQKIKVFLVTHAPFVRENQTRTLLQKILVKAYDFFIGPRTLRKFNKVFSITRWEESELKKLGLSKNQISYIPNGIPEEFFKRKIKKTELKKILFLGRISPIKNLDFLLEEFSSILKKYPEMSLEIVGFSEERYKFKLEKKATLLGIKNKIKFVGPIYSLSKKIKKLQEADFFVLPSKREALPQALLEAMSLGKIVLASKTKGAEEIIIDKINGFLFDTKNEDSLKEKIIFCKENSKKEFLEKMQKNARKTAENYRWNQIIKILDQEIKQ
jgi:glycosyltransferase involved in cell wall biosynthesis